MRKFIARLKCRYFLYFNSIVEFLFEYLHQVRKCIIKDHFNKENKLNF